MKEEPAPVMSVAKADLDAATRLAAARVVTNFIALSPHCVLTAVCGPPLCKPRSRTPAAMI